MSVEIPEDDANYMYDFIDRIIKDIGPRMPCSKQEAKAADIIQDELKKTCDEAHIEAFKCHPRAFLGWLPIVVCLILGSAASFFFLSSINIIFAAALTFGIVVIAFIILWYEFFNYREFIDPLFPKRSSQNVIGTIKAKTSRKRVLLFAGHHDSALQFNLLAYLKHGYLVLIFLGLVVFFIWFFLTGLNFISAVFNLGWEAWLGSWAYRLIVYPGCFYVWPALIGMLLFVWPGEWANKVPGAVDNLSAVAVVLGLGRYLHKHRDIIPDDLEIRLISFGCEEAGLRGAYRYAAAHLEELKQLDSELFNMDSMMSPKHLKILESEPTTRTRHSKEVVAKIKKAAERVNEPFNTFGESLLVKIFGSLSGGTDAAAFSKAKLKAASIMSMSLKKYPLMYHQPSDTLDQIERGALEQALKIAIGYILNESV
ncbi:MAG: M28 family peptidase [Promethearchaeota archaeon]|nr:MAG: M28 family peptidase [Candidatus Lokiarchaeota archaeon]